MSTHFILDVRTPSEYAASHKEGAVNLDLRLLSTGQMPNVSKDEPIEVYCATGARSALAKHMLEQSGFTDVRDGGGYSA